MAELLNIEETAKELRVSISVVRQWIFQQRFPVVKLGGRVLIRREDIDEFVEKNIRPAREKQGVGNAKG